MRRPPPSTAIPAGSAAAAAAVVAGARTVREVADRCGWSSSHTALTHLRRARALGLVTFDDGRGGGTLRPALEIVAGNPGAR